MMRSKNFIINLIIVILGLIFTFELSDGARFGGARSGGSRYGGKTRYESSAKVRYGTRYSVRPWGYTYPTWHDYALAGYIYGYHSYTSRSYYYSQGKKEPTICHNEHDYVSSNGTVYAWFICPSDDLSDKYKYCCGDSERERCCTYWDVPGKKTALAVSIVGGILVFVLLSYCCFLCRERGKSFCAERVMASRSLSVAQAEPIRSVNDSHQTTHPLLSQPDAKFSSDTYDPPNYTEATSSQAYSSGAGTSYPIHPEGPGYPSKPPSSSKFQESQTPPYPTTQLPYPPYSSGPGYPMPHDATGVTGLQAVPGVTPSAPPFYS